MVLLQDNRFHYRYVKSISEGKPVLRLYSICSAQTALLREISLNESETLYLSVQGNTTSYSFYYGYTEREMLLLQDKADASLLCSTVNNGFTGTYIGMYASSNHVKSSNHADFDWFQYYTAP